MTREEQERHLDDVVGLSVEDVEKMMGILDKAITSGEIETNFDVITWLASRDWKIEQKIFCGICYGGYYAQHKQGEPVEDLNKVTFH